MVWHEGDLFVSGHTNDRVIRFNGRSGRSMGAVTHGFLDWATGVDFGPDGNVYVASFFDDSVARFDPQSGVFMGTFAANAFGAEGIEFAPDGDLYVASYHGDSVDRFDGQTGAWKRSMWGGGLDGPMDVAFRRR